MKWYTKEYNRPEHGVKRVISKFLILPICLKGECRWLERAEIEQYSYYGEFSNMRWADKKD